MVVVDGHVARGAVHLGRRGHDDAIDTLVAARVEQVHGPEHIRLHEVSRVHVRVGDRDQRAKVEHDLGFLHERADRLRILQVARDDLDRLIQIGRKVLEEAMAPLRVVSDEGPNASTLTGQRLGKMASDEPARARDDDAAPLPLPHGRDDSVDEDYRSRKSRATVKCRQA